MAAEIEPMERAEQFSLPMDIGEWVAPGTLMAWIQDEVEKLDWSHPEVVKYLSQHPDYHPKMMLTLLVFAYASQVYGSEEVARKCYDDATFRLVCGAHPPTPQELIRFRRENRGLLKGILGCVFMQAVREKFGLGSTLVPAGLRGYLFEQALERLNIARHMDSLNE